MTDMELADVLANCPFHTEAGSPAIYRKVPEVIAGRIIAALRRAALAQTEIKGHMRVEDDLKAEVANYRARESDLDLGVLHRALDKAQARIAELEKDAARYRWLRESGPGIYNYWVAHGVMGSLSHWKGEHLDVAIDAALKSHI